MKRELQVGDRVAVYGVNSGVTWRRVGMILDWGPQAAKVEFPGGRPYEIVHPKQCRRLIRRERRRVWLYQDLLSQQDASMRWAPPTHSQDQWVEFVEARPRKAGR